jgi:polysaccharide pyruvyl transferase CsaB
MFSKMKDSPTGDHKITILGWYGNQNGGDEAVLEMLVNSLRTMNPQGEITVFSANPVQTARQYQVQSVHKGFLHNLWRTIEEIRTADLFLIGGGTLLEDHSSSWSGIASVWAYLLMAFLLRTPVMFYAQGIGPIQRKFNRVMTGVLVNHVDLITVRDQASQDLLREIGVTKPPITVTGDPAINIQSPQPEQIEAILKREGLMHRERPWVAFCPKATYGVEAKFAELIDKIIDELDVNVVLIPMQTDGAINDRKCLDTIASTLKRVDRVLTLSGEYTPSELKGILSTMDLVVAMRLHALIFASAAYVPAIAVAYGSKVANFMKMIHQEEWVVEVEHFSVPDTYAKIQKIWVQRQEVASQLQTNVVPYQRQAATTAVHIKSLLGKVPIRSHHWRFDPSAN